MDSIDFKSKGRIVIKVGTHSLTHADTGFIDYIKIERLVMEICNLRNMGKEVVLVSSGAIATGRQTLELLDDSPGVSIKQALASIGQARLMSLYEKFFSQFNQIPAQVLITRQAVIGTKTFENALNTFNELFRLNAVPVVNANDTVSTFEIKHGDNDTLSAIVADLIGADLLIILTDTEGLYDKDPKKDRLARLIPVVEEITDSHIDSVSASAGTDMGVGGMKTKLIAGKIATKRGIDMVIASGMDMSIISRIFSGNFVGTSFLSNPDINFNISEFIGKA